jgi:HK97 family phage portal protein
VADSFLTRLRHAFRPETKSAGSLSGVTITPGLHFHSPDGTRTIFRFGESGNSEAEHVTAATAYAAAAYAFVAMRWRAERLAEPPLMVVRENQTDGSEEWLPRHPLANLLAEPNDDCDMGEMLFRTSLSIDMSGRALWLKDTDRGGRPARLQLFRGDEFTVESTRQRVRGRYRIQTATGQEVADPESVIYFHEPHPTDWLLATSRLDVCLSWLNMGQVARATVRDLLNNSLSPSLVVQPDPSWNPNQEEMARFKEGLDVYASPGQRGKALVLVGGGKATPVSTTVKDLVPSELLNRVEAVVSSVFGVPAIVLQHLVGMENSPWSQMAQARRMAYEDTAVPMWRTVEKALTRQLLREADPDPMLFVRYDTTRVPALQADRASNTQIASAWSDIASANERRALVGLEPVEDAAADEMPWQTMARRSAELDARLAAMRNATAADPAQDDPPADPEGKIERKSRRDLWAALRAEEMELSQYSWALTASRLLDKDAAAVQEAVTKYLGGAKADTPSPDQRKRFFRWVNTFFKEASKARWQKDAEALALSSAERATATLAADFAIDFALARPGLAEFAAKEASFLAQSVSETTAEQVVRVVTATLDSGASTAQVAKAVREASGFSRDRAMLVARTESARLMNGAPTDMLRTIGERDGRKFVKVWSTSLDDRVREEHIELEGEKVDVDANFSNGLSFPSEPNCRCVVTFEEVVA